MKKTDTEIEKNIEEIQKEEITINETKPDNEEEITEITEENNITEEEKIEDIIEDKVEEIIDTKESQKEYKEKKEPKNFSLIEVIILIIITATISMSIGMIIIGHKNKTAVKQKTKDEYLENFIETYNYIVDNYYEKIDKEQLINKAIEGMTNSLDDPYSTYIDEEEADNFNINLRGNYEGLGISIVKDPETKYIMVYYTFKDSPADKAGLKSLDLIKSIDGQLTDEIDATEFSESILKNPKKDYELVIIRDGEEFTINLSKENVTIDSVSSEIIEKNDKKIGYIYISIFANNTAGQFIKQLEELEKENIDSLIIDVRSNTGGHLIAADGILNHLLTKKQITYQLKTGEKIDKYYGSAQKNKDYEIVILTNEYSASASEVLTYSLKENLNSKVIGKKTYGKGTVQELVTLKNGVQYKITTQKWLSPNGNWVNDTEGIIPDIEVELDKKYFETYEKEDDNQLQAAIDYIVNK